MEFSGNLAHAYAVCTRLSFPPPHNQSLGTRLGKSHCSAVGHEKMGCMYEKIERCLGQHCHVTFSQPALALARARRRLRPTARALHGEMSMRTSELRTWTEHKIILSPWNNTIKFFKSVYCILCWHCTPKPLERCQSLSSTWQHAVAVPLLLTISLNNTNRFRWRARECWTRALEVTTAHLLKSLTEH